jgi:hypothetical protein
LIELHYEVPRIAQATKYGRVDVSNGVSGVLSFLDKKQQQSLYLGKPPCNSNRKTLNPISLQAWPFFDLS